MRLVAIAVVVAVVVRAAVVVMVVLVLVLAAVAAAADIAHNATSIDEYNTSHNKDAAASASAGGSCWMTVQSRPSSPPPSH
jgi:hypothetical protein